MPDPQTLDQVLAAEEEVPQPVLDLKQTVAGINARNLLESYHDALQARDETMSLFGLGLHHASDAGGG